MTTTLPRPRTLQGTTQLIETGHGRIYVTINTDAEGQPFELFATLGKADPCTSANLEAIARLIALSMRNGIEISEIIQQLIGISCCTWFDEGLRTHSIPDALAKTLQQYNQPIQETTQEPIKQPVAKPQGMHIQFQPKPEPQLTTTQLAAQTATLLKAGKCPECTSPLVYEEGCETCTGCGWSKC